MNSRSRQRCYSELVEVPPTMEDRFSYLQLGAHIGRQTFGFDRWLNQQFYQSVGWQRAREAVIIRDEGCDLGIPGFEIYSGLLVHHMNPVTKEDIVDGASWILDPEYLICTTKCTHNAIHYGDATLLPRGPVERTIGDTNLW